MQLVRASQRRSVRRSVRVDCQVVRERDFKLLGKNAIDLSPEGMLVVSGEPVLTGEPVIVSFRVPATDVWLDAEATIARVVHGRRPGDRARCLGVQFDALDAEARELLCQQLQGRPPPVPLRAPRIDYAASVQLAALE